MGVADNTCRLLIVKQNDTVASSFRGIDAFLLVGRSVLEVAVISLPHSPRGNIG